MVEGSSPLSPRPSLIALSAVVAGAVAQLLLSAVGDYELSNNRMRLWELLFGSAWAWWVHVDRRLHRLGFAFEFDAFVFFAWPFVVPYYLLQSRHARSRGSALYAWLLLLAPLLATGVMLALYWFSEA